VRRGLADFLNRGCGNLHLFGAGKIAGQDGVEFCEQSLRGDPFQHGAELFRRHRPAARRAMARMPPEKDGRAEDGINAARIHRRHGDAPAHTAGCNMRGENQDARHARML
jgi:hypothetical protein